MIVKHRLAYETFMLGYRGRRRLIMLDYDGTLAPFTPDRERAYIPAGLSAVLNRVSVNSLNVVVVVSGRSVLDVARLLRASHVTRIPMIFGAHGFERMDRVGSIYRIELDQNDLHVLDRVFRALEEKIPPHCLERKYSSVAVHVRGLSDRESGCVLDVAMSVFEREVRNRFRVRGFDGGLEFRSVLADKGKAVSSIMDECGDAVPLYMGDDDTDEDAFLALKGCGLGVKVGDEYGDTSADVVIAHHEVARFLERFE